MTDIAIELFAGPGGWSHGQRLARPDIFSVGVEWDADACATARAAGHTRIQGDVVEMREPVLDLFSAFYQHHSPPCQGFSLAGKGRGRKDAEALLWTLQRMVGVTDLDKLLQLVEEFDMVAHDHRSALTLEPLIWILMGQPTYVSMEQVRTVLPIWVAVGEVLRSWGYSVWTGTLYSEQYGVAQTRTRAILMARRDGIPAEPPAPTHSRYRSDHRLDPGLPKWVPMSAVLDLPEVDYFRSNYNHGGTGERGRRTPGDPAFTVTSKRKHWVLPSGEWLALDPSEAGVLQSFPYDYPWRGGQVSRYQQVGDAVPPLMAAAIVKELIP